MSDEWLQVAIRALQADVTGLAITLANLTRGHVDRSLRLEEAVTKLRTDVMGRIDRLQDAMTQQQESDLVNWSAGERAEKIAKDARAAMQSETSSLGEQVAALVRMVRTLQGRVDHIEQDRGPA